jgi:hypothetical protein
MPSGVLGRLITAVRGTYDRHEYFVEKQRAFEALASEIKRISGLPRDNVFALRV